MRRRNRDHDFSQLQALVQETHERKQEEEEGEVFEEDEETHDAEAMRLPITPSLLSSSRSSQSSLNSSVCSAVSVGDAPNTVLPYTSSAVLPYLPSLGTPKHEFLHNSSSTSSASSSGGERAASRRTSHLLLLLAAVFGQASALRRLAVWWCMGVCIPFVGLHTCAPLFVWRCVKLNGFSAGM